MRKAVLRQYLSWRRRLSSGEVTVADVPDSAAAGADNAERIAVRQHLWHLLAKLPRMQRAVIVLRYFEDLDDDDIGRLLGCARATVRVHAARGLQRLRQDLPVGSFTTEV